MHGFELEWFNIINFLSINSLNHLEYSTLSQFIFYSGFVDVSVKNLEITKF